MWRTDYPRVGGSIPPYYHQNQNLTLRLPSPARAMFPFGFTLKSRRRQFSAAAGAEASATREVLLNARYPQSIVGRRRTDTELLGNLLARFLPASRRHAGGVSRR